MSVKQKPTSAFALQNLNKIALHIDINVAVAVEGTAAFFVAAEGADEVRVFDKLLLWSMMARGGRDVAPQRQIPTSH